MIKVDTGSPLIHRFEEAISDSFCDSINEAMHKIIVNPNPTFGSRIPPWMDNDAIFADDNQFNSLINEHIIADHTSLIDNLVEEYYEFRAYARLKAIHIWRPGRSIDFHQDLNKFDVEDRVVASITYCTDDFSGGETIIRTNNGYEYASKPKKGTLILFPGELWHAVPTVFGGDRVTIGMWHTNGRDNASEIIDFY